LNMQDNLRRTTKRIALGFLFAFMVMAFVASAYITAPVSAQGAAPTATPSDPVWRAFVAARSAVEEERSVDLTIVRGYTFEQTEWPKSIDGCREDVLDVDFRQVYHGWNIQITDLTGKTHVTRVSFDLKAVVVCDRIETAGSTPATTTDNGDLPDPVAGGGVGGSFELGGHVTSITSEAKTAMTQAGMTWVKKQVRHSLGDGTGLAQSYIEAAKANGYKVLLGIVGDPTQLGADFDGYVAEYSKFVGDVAALGADAIEVWNEPNIDREWPAGQINGGNYTKLLAAAYNAIKTKNPNTIVISGAPAPTGYFGAAGCAAGGCNDDTFMQQMAAAGAGSYMDCVGLHYNEGIVSPSTSSGDKRGEYPSYYFGSMLARGYNPFGGKPVCFSELGYLSDEGFDTEIPAAFGWASDVTVAEQASWLAQAATIAAQSGKVRLMIIWNVNFTVWNSDPQAGYAMIRPDGTCPACAALGTVMKK